MAQVSSLGASLRSARKSAGLSLEELSGRTNIRASLITQFEDDNFVGAGGSTYARGHIRNIAAALKCDAAELLDLYDVEHGEATRLIHDQLVESNVSLPKERREPITWRALVGVSLSLLLVAGVGKVVLSNVSANKSLNAVVASKPTPKPSVTPTPSVAPSEAATTPSPSATPVLSNGAGISLFASAVRGKSWVFVSDGAGVTLFSGQLKQGESKSFNSSVALYIKIGDAGAVDLQVNGKKVPSLGGPGVVGEMRFTPKS